ncbi:glycosyltransferase [Duganella sp. Dugasp56]|uniref:glycosyltransferase n=1 Tax=Duganella sp. Dugasp56 TaxID=3243046 RepID=UPI0039B0263F
MHVVDVTMFYGGGGGGITTYLDAKARWLAGRADMRHTIASPNLPPHAGAVAQAGPPHTVALPGIALPGLHGYRMPRSAEAVTRVLLRLQPDLIETGDAGPCGWAAVHAARRLGVPLVGFYHSDLPQLVRKRFGSAAGRMAQQYVRRLYRHCDLLLAPSAAMVRRLATLGLHAHQQPLGIDTVIFHPQRAHGNLRADLGLPASARLLVYAGRFNSTKKLDLLDAAVRRLGAPYHLLMVGGRAPRRSGPVSVLPFQTNPRALARLLAGCDALVHAGDSETFGLIVLEAMACGLPAVVTSAGGIGELVAPGTGVVVKPNSASSLAEGIDALYAGDLAGMGERARRTACTHYDWNRVLPHLLDHYHALREPGSASVGR